MKNSTIELTKAHPDFNRLKAVLVCASKDPTRPVINKVLVKNSGENITITATDGRRLRTDVFTIDAVAGIYDIKTNTAGSVFLMRNKEKLTFPKTDQVIPSLDPLDAYALEGTGGQFVLWASSALGCMVNPDLIALGDHEKVTLYIQKKRSDLSPAVMKNDQTTFVLMPLTLKEPWMQQLEEIRMAKAA
jgi:hypothetical protein